MVARALRSIFWCSCTLASLLFLTGLVDTFDYRSLGSPHDYIGCYVLRLQEAGFDLMCHVNGTTEESDNETAVLSKEILSELVVHDKYSGKNYTIAGLPSPVVGLSVKIAGRASLESSIAQLFPKLNELYLYGDAFRHSFIRIPEDAFEHAPELKKLRMKSISIASNETVAWIRSAKNVETLTITECDLKILASDGFRGLSKLKSLALIKNPILRIEAGAFDGLSNLYSIEVSVSLLSWPLPPGLFEDLEKLEKLDFEFSRISKINNATFRGLRSLRFLKLLLADIDSVESGSFDDLIKLKDMNLYGNDIRSLPENIFEKMVSLERLHLTRNKIIQVNATTFRGLKSLKKLDLTSNELTKVEAGAFDDLINLELLGMAGNPLKSLPDGLFDKTVKLRNVKFHRTCVENLGPSNFTNHPDFEIMTLQSNCNNTISDY